MTRRTHGPLAGTARTPDRANNRPENPGRIRVSHPRGLIPADPGADRTVIQTPFRWRSPMAAIRTTERTTRRRTRVDLRSRPTCVRRAVAPETVPAMGPMALTSTRRGAETRGVPAGRGDAHFGEPRGVTLRNEARSASPATFRRRRLVALLGLVAALAIVGQAGAALGGPSLGAPTRSAAVHRYVARDGDSLWVAAARLAPDEDPRAVVDALVHARGNGPLMPGEVLRWQR